MKTIRYIHSLMATVLICFSSQFTIAQTIPSPVIDSVLTVDHDFFFNGEIIVPYSTGHVSVTNNANIQIHSTIDVDLLPGFTASVDSGCGEFVAGIRGCPYVEASKVISNVSCYGQNDGSVDISIGNTTNQYKYLWSVGGDTKHIKKNLSAGTYLITIVDSTACNILDSVTISQPDSIISYISTSLATCGDSTGTASVHITGGKNPFTYYWYPYGGSDSIVSNLISGNYELIIRDSNFCSQKYYFEIGDSNGAEIHVDSIRNATCSSFPDGAIFTHYSGGTPPLNCIWQGSNDTGSVILNLSSGTYKLLVQDSLGCKNYKSVQVSEPDPIVISFFNNSTICNQNTGSAYAIVSGGVTPYSYLWTSGSTDSVANQLGNGIQRILVTDHNGCTSTDSTSIESGGGPQIVINNIKNVTCFDGSDGKASVEVLSGNAPFTYLWLPDSTTTDTIDNIKAGNHMVIVKDVNGCETSSIVNIIDPPKIKITILYDPPSNDSTSDGNLYSTVSGGEQDYTYQWSLNNLNTADINQISSGPYSLFITDAKGCQAIERVQVRANIFPCINLSSNVPCSVASPTPCGSSHCYKDIVLDFGADPTGNTNSTCSFQAAAEFFNNRQGHGTLYIPPGDYTVGEQNTGGGFWLTGDDILCFENCTDLTIRGKITGISPLIKFENCLKFGLFNPTTGDRNIYSTGNCCDVAGSGCGVVQYHECATTGIFLIMKNCLNVSIQDLEIDGNSENYIYGGHYCDGIQLPSDGIVFENSSRILVENVKVHHFGRDGLGLYDNSGRIRNINLIVQNSQFNYNDRCGLDWAGGSVAEFHHTQFNYNASARFISRAADGVDFEYFGGQPIKQGLFSDCEFMFNSYCGVEASSSNGYGQCRDMQFNRCKFVSSETNSIANSFSMSIPNPNFEFNSCEIYGTLIHVYEDRDCQGCWNNDNVKFKRLSGLQPRTVFSENYNNFSHVYNQSDEDACNGAPYPSLDWLIDLGSNSSARALFSECDIKSNWQARLAYVYGPMLQPWNRPTILRCNFYNYGLIDFTLGSLNYFNNYNNNLFIVNNNYDFYPANLFTEHLINGSICVPKYVRAPYLNEINDAYNCFSCRTYLPAICPADCNPCNEARLNSELPNEPSTLISIIPNPVFNSFYISDVSIGEEITIFSLQGSFILRRKICQMHEQIDVHELVPGIYIVRSSSNNLYKLVKI